MILATLDTSIVVAIYGIAGSVALYLLGKIFEYASLHIAIRAEIGRTIEAITNFRRIWVDAMERSTTDRFTLVPFYTAVYDAQLENVGMLLWDVKSVVRFFGYVKFVNAYQETRPPAADIEKTREFIRHYPGVLATLLTKTTRSFLNASEYKILLESLQASKDITAPSFEIDKHS
jgi:hypothetical protein